MKHDLVIRGGKVVDGSGEPARLADVAVNGDRISAVGSVEARGRREIDATGKIVSPGFVDIHTHLDAQLGWDPIGTSSCFHGVTSVVLGNCGVTFAPCKPADREYLAELMESVEDIPRDSILNGLPWDWQSYGDYLAMLDRLPKGVNVGGMVGHCAVRYHAMGERSLDEKPALREDITNICNLVDEAMASGALGFSTSRTFLHRVPDGRPVPGTYAQPEELLAVGQTMGRHGCGVFEAAARLGERDAPELPNTRAEVAWMGELSRSNNLKVTFGLAHSERRETLYQSVIDFATAENEQGAQLRPQTTSRPIGSLYGLHNRTMFDRFPCWQELKKLNLAKRLERLQSSVSRQLLIDDVKLDEIDLDFNRLFILREDSVRYDMQSHDSLAAYAQRVGKGIVEAFIDLNLASQGECVFYYAFLNQRMDPIEEMLKQPIVAMGLGDSGAHVGQIMDASQPTWLLAYWVRERGFMSVEDAVRRWTSDTADLFGIRDRGRIEESRFADLNVIDLEKLALEVPKYVHDFPGGAGRYIQKARGYDYTITNGRLFMDHGEHAGGLAGVVLRNDD